MDNTARMLSEAAMTCNCLFLREQHNFLCLEEQARAQREAQNATGHLFVLPPELRNEIYRLCDIDQSEPTERKFAGTEILQPSRIPTEQLQQSITPKTGLSQTCRALRAETLSMFYGSNVFTAEIDNTIITDHKIVNGFKLSGTSLLSLPDKAFRFLTRVEVSFCVRALSRFSQSTTKIVVELRGGHPASLGVEGEDKQDFGDVKRTLLRLVERLNRQSSRTFNGIRREDTSHVIDIMKRIIQQDRDRYPDRKRRLRAYMEEPVWMLK